MLKCSSRNSRNPTGISQVREFRVRVAEPVWGILIVDIRYMRDIRNVSVRYVHIAEISAADPIPWIVGFAPAERAPSISTPAAKAEADSPSGAAKPRD
jgi:hypothetical protein